MWLTWRWLARRRMRTNESERLPRECFVGCFLHFFVRAQRIEYFTCKPLPDAMVPLRTAGHCHALHATLMSGTRTSFPETKLYCPPVRPPDADAAIVARQHLAADRKRDTTCGHKTQNAHRSARFACSCPIGPVGRPNVSRPPHRITIEARSNHQRTITACRPPSPARRRAPAAVATGRYRPPAPCPDDHRPCRRLAGQRS